MCPIARVLITGCCLLLASCATIEEAPVAQAAEPGRDVAAQSAPKLTPEHEGRDNTRPPGPTEEFLAAISKLFTLPMLSPRDLEELKVETEVASSFEWFFPESAQSVRYRIARSFEGVDLERARLELRTRFYPGQSLRTELELPIKDRDSICISESLVRERFGPDFKRSSSSLRHFGPGQIPPPGLRRTQDALTYTSASNLSIAFVFDFDCASGIRVSQQVIGATRPFKPNAENPAPSRQPATLPEFIDALAKLQSLEPNALGTALRARVSLSATGRLFDGRRVPEDSFYRVFDYFDTIILGAASLSIRSENVVSEPRIAILHLYIKNPVATCVRANELLHAGATRGTAAWRDLVGRLYGKIDGNIESLLTPAGIQVDLRYAQAHRANLQECAQSMLLTQELKR